MCIDWGYVAGFFDGEGYCNFHPGLVIVFYQNDRRPLDAIKSFLKKYEISSCLYPVIRVNSKRHPNKGWRLCIYGIENVYSFLWHVKDIVIVKDENVLAIMAEIERRSQLAREGKLKRWNNHYAEIGG